LALSRKVATMVFPHHPSPTTAAFSIFPPRFAVPTPSWLTRRRG
jgi:hypothetical protein